MCIVFVVFCVNVCHRTLVSATVHTTLPLTSSFLISLAVQFLCVSRFCFFVLSGAVYVYVYVYVYYVSLCVSVSVSVSVSMYLLERSSGPPKLRTSAPAISTRSTCLAAAAARTRTARPAS